MSVTVVICARNEIATLPGILEAVGWTGLPRVVVDDSSTDGTGDLADVHGTWGDKGSAMAAGLARVTTPLVLFLDADLHGLGAATVDALATVPPVHGQVVGLRDNGVSELSGWLPQISGERRLPVAVARRAHLAGAGWAAEQRLNAAVGRAGLPHRHYLMHGVTNPSEPKPTQWAAVALASVALAPGLAEYVLSPNGRARVPLGRTRPPGT
jgi:hypothetical protein